MKQEPYEYNAFRRAAKWCEEHGLIQFPNKEYAHKLGVDPTKHVIPFKPCKES